jgi:ABC-2 type transport system permease protein
MAHLTPAPGDFPASTSPVAIGPAPAQPGPSGGSLFSPLARRQYAALARLRWATLRNGIRSVTGMFEAGAAAVTLLLYAAIGIGIGCGLGAAAYGLASSAHWQYLPILFWLVFFLWQIVPVLLASFQEQFDLSILLRFPVRFDSFCLMYLIFGLMDASTILGGLCSAGILTGITVARPDLFAPTALALVVFAAFNILLVRAIFAWIERWLAQRKTREILGAVFMVVLLSLQLLNPAIYRSKHSGPRQVTYGESQAEKLRAARARFAPLVSRVNDIQQWLPPGLAGQAVRRSAEKQPDALPKSLGLLAACALLCGGVLAIRLKAEYRGENLGVAPARVKAAPGRIQAAIPAALSSYAGTPSVTQARSIAAPIAAIIEKEARSLLRTLPLLYAIGAPLLLVLVFSAIIRNGSVESTSFPLALPVCMVYAQLGFTQVFYNSLGAEAGGIQLYFFSPTPIRTALLAKNIFHACLFALSALLAGTLAALRLGVPSTAVLCATAAWLVFSLPCNLAAGNIVSVKMAYKVNPGRIARSKGSQGNSLFSLLMQLVFLAVAASVFALCWFLGRLWLATPIFLVLAAGAIFVWIRILDNADALAAQRRDELIATLMKAA